MESRLATLTLDTDDLSKLSEMANRPDLPSTFQPRNIAQTITTLPVLFNSLNVRRAIIPAANGHCSARALARYYAALADGGEVPPPHSSLSKPPLGCHHHIPRFTKSQEKQKKSKEILAALKKKTNYKEKKYSSEDLKVDGHGGDNLTRLINDGSSGSGNNSSTTGNTENCPDSKSTVSSLFRNPRIRDAFLGVGEYRNLVVPNGKFGLGFRRVDSNGGSLIGFGHSGMGGSTGFCDIENRFAIAVTLNKMSFGGVTAKIIQLVCSELNLPIPEEYLRSGTVQQGQEVELARPIIN